MLGALSAVITGRTHARSVQRANEVAIMRITNANRENGFRLLYGDRFCGMRPDGKPILQGKTNIPEVASK